ncbi:uncharacterized protein LOC131801046 [Musca domestica]|uniref:Uncharacterized protein LOC131801046 n=1 Tax=Musca domestica TaxID=7370 RepID=A0ABM3UN84_MUSDO|nr:uncharacterized protein LOC131801046 [Musca domestica]
MELPNIPKPEEEKTENIYWQIMEIESDEPMQNRPMEILKKENLKLIQNEKELRAENDELKQKIEALTKERNALTCEVAKLKTELDNFTRKCIVPSVNTSEEALTLARMGTDERKVYTKKERDIAQNIYFRGARCYKFMRENIKFNLPSPRSLGRWQHIRSLNPGIDIAVVNSLKAQVQNMSERERICFVVHDEVEIKPVLEYNKAEDVVDGFEDFGKNRRSKEMARRCLFFMIKGICSDWKFIISFYPVSKNTTKAVMHNVLCENLQVIQDIGLDVRSIVCDQGATNIGLYSFLTTSKYEPYFFFNGHKIYCMYDYCNLIKSIRNNLITHGYKTISGEVINFEYVRRIYEIDNENPNIKMCPKLTEKHINPALWDKMSVSRATEVLSNSVAAAMHTCMQNGCISDDAYPTAEFIKRLNDIFDELNVKTTSSANPNNKAIYRNCKHKIARLEEARDYFGSFVVNSKATVQCIDGFWQTIQCILLLSEDIFRDYPNIQFILSGKLNQDALENFFSRIRSSLGNNTHPSVKEVRYISAKIISSDILKATKNTNSEEDGSISLPISLKNTGNIHIIEYLKLEHSNSDSEDDSEFLEDINLCETQVKSIRSVQQFVLRALQL